ncbi:flagellar protein [Pseudohoeflea sp. DP4N28-3]|uniref:Flagellar protein n=2 Tax=Pseudohoeflea coraliihabitans TaxID=2860393 RepID=A0ABS6WNB1_9HYPH|nr:flagellar protein [Pseudohoeflea sp. DP4N28-3]
MSDHDVEPDRHMRRQPRRDSDRVLIVVGFTIAAAAALFPWYVFFNHGQFSAVPALWNRSQGLPEKPGRVLADAVPRAGSATDKDAVRDFDDITTATVGEPSESDAKGPRPQLLEDPLSQPFPAVRDFRLLHVANGRALIEDASGIFVVRQGSVLPDQSTLTAMEERQGRWVLVTSRGQVVSQQ